MRSPLAWFCLLLALSAQPMRQAEAADDCARAIADLLVPNGTIDLADGGVGDEALDATLKAADALSAASLNPSHCDGSLLTSFLTSPSPLFSNLPGFLLGSQGTGLLPRASRRLAWLQLLQI